MQRWVTPDIAAWRLVGAISTALVVDVELSIDCIGISGF